MLVELHVCLPVLPSYTKPQFFQYILTCYQLDIEPAYKSLSTNNLAKPIYVVVNISIGFFRAFQLVL